MILLLELILSVVYGLFCFLIVKKSEREVSKQCHKNRVLSKRLNNSFEENNKLSYELDNYVFEIEEKVKVIESLTKEVMSAEEDKAKLKARIEELKCENLDIWLELQKGDVKDGKNKKSKTL